MSYGIRIRLGKLRNGSRVAFRLWSESALLPQVGSQFRDRCRSCRHQRTAKKTRATGSEGRFRTHRTSRRQNSYLRWSRAVSKAASRLPPTHPGLQELTLRYSHPSEEKFGVEEATVSELVDFFEKEKLCSVEPGGKPCDHCAMCSSRGF